MTGWNLKKLQNFGTSQCAKCLQNFNENDIVATTTSKMYCYECATLINLVTGKIDKDLNHHKFIPKVLHEIESITKKLKMNEDVSMLSALLVTTAIKNKNHVSNNEIGLACAAIFLACKIKNNHVADNTFPVSQKTVQKNFSLLQKNLTAADIFKMSKTIHEMKN